MSQSIADLLHLQAAQNVSDLSQLSPLCCFRETEMLSFAALEPRSVCQRARGMAAFECSEASARHVALAVQRRDSCAVGCCGLGARFVHRVKAVGHDVQLPELIFCRIPNQRRDSRAAKRA